MKNGLDDEKWKTIHNEITKYYIYKIRGTGLNNIAAVGGFGEVIHFNGNTWESFIAMTKLGYGSYYSVSIKNNVIAAVGQDSPKAVIIIGRR
jgi:phosphoribosylaminoimidazole (AIR) synthetase